TAPAQGLREAGWAVGRNLWLDVRWSSGDLARLRKDAAELIALPSEVLVAGPGPATPTLVQATRRVPIVLTQTLDPGGAGYDQKHRPTRPARAPVPRKSRSRFPTPPRVNKRTRVELPQGRAPPATKPSLTGSSPTPKTIGIVEVAASRRGPDCLPS